MPRKALMMPTIEPKKRSRRVVLKHLDGTMQILGIGDKLYEKFNGSFPSHLPELRFPDGHSNPAKLVEVGEHMILYQEITAA